MMHSDEDYIKKAWPGLNILAFFSTGDYQGTNYVIGYADGKVLACGYGYGSCSGCGAWGEGGEPTSPKDLIDAGVYGKSLVETLVWLKAQSSEFHALEKNDAARLAVEVARAFVLVERS